MKRLDTITWIAAIGIFAFAFFLAFSAKSQQMVCFPHEVVDRALRGEPNHEAPIAMGLDATGMMVEVYAGGDGKTWTIVATQPNGMACLLAGGADWEAITPKQPGEAM